MAGRRCPRADRVPAAADGAAATPARRPGDRTGKSAGESRPQFPEFVQPPSTDGPGFKAAERRKGSGRKRGGQPGHPGAGPEKLPMERSHAVAWLDPERIRQPRIPFRCWASLWWHRPGCTKGLAIRKVFDHMESINVSSLSVP